MSDKKQRTPMVVLPIYFEVINSLVTRQEQTLDIIFVRLSKCLDPAIIDEKHAQQLETVLQAGLASCTGGQSRSALELLEKYKPELMRVYSVLKPHLHGQSVDALPFAISEFLASEMGRNLTQAADIPFLYIICSIFMPPFLKLIETRQSLAIQLTLSNPEHLCFSLNFDDLNNIYLNEGLFLQMMLEKPLRIINQFPTLKGYDLYQNISLTELFDVSESPIQQPNCLVTSTIINRRSVQVIETFNLEKIISTARIFTKRHKNNNSLLNDIEKLTALSFFSQNKNPQNKQLSSESFCLTLLIPKQILSKMRPFLDWLPPELAPLTKYDILSFGTGDQAKTMLFRFATEDYWEHCPPSEFLEVYYLCNASYVEWISIPRQQYKQTKRIRFWNKNQIQQICEKRFGARRGVQKRGDLVVIGQGRDHFWRVRSGCGAAVLLKWSVLLKQKSQITKYIQIVQDKQKQLFQNGWRIEIPHRNIILSYLSHEYSTLDRPILRQLVNFVRAQVRSEQKQFSNLCLQYHKQIILNRSSISNKFRICGSCGREILNIFAFINHNFVCLWCLPTEIRRKDSTFRFQTGYFCKPSQLDTFLQRIHSKEIQISKLDTQTCPNHIFEEYFCEGRYLGSIQQQQCSGKIINNNYKYTQNHLLHCLTSLQLHVFVKRSFFCTLTSAIKYYALKKSTNEEEVTELKAILKFLGRNCLSLKQKLQVKQQMSKYYREDNQVLSAVHLLTDVQITE